MSLDVTLGVTSDVPEKTRTTLGGKTVLVSPAIQGGETVSFDLRKAPHLLISGTTGSGKSTAIHAILCDLLSAYSPWECGLCLIDPKRVELQDYDGRPHLSGPGNGGNYGRYSDPLDAIAALEWLLCQVDARFGVMEACGARDIDLVPWDALVSAQQPRAIVLVVDELADLLMAHKYAQRDDKGVRRHLSDPEVTLARILQVGRAAGVHAVMATQRPSTDVVTGVIKANVPSRLTFALQSATDSRVAMGRRGAEELTGCGDALWLPAGARTPVRMQGRMVTEAERYVAGRLTRASAVTQ